MEDRYGRPLSPPPALPSSPDIMMLLDGGELDEDQVMSEVHLGCSPNHSRLPSLILPSLFRFVVKCKSSSLSGSLIPGSEINPKFFREVTSDINTVEVNASDYKEWLSSAKAQKSPYLDDS
ncbi:unnamed protein product [Ilex paraguariensis]|uniref:Uncharacterized protein n=1 Tax=Ilex paraguariensis TaxID=185542 RepID=A0ABC8TDX0_9AQUA